MNRTSRLRTIGAAVDLGFMERTQSGNADELRARLVAHLERTGRTPWRDSLLAVPRHHYAPETFWHGTRRGYVPLHHGDDEGAWLGLAYVDRPMVVQVDDGTPTGGVGRWATCTLPAPSDLLTVLAAADVRPGLRVCEVGTGTGYTAALLADRVGPENVTTVEIDPTLVERARQRLGAAGLGQVASRHQDGAQLTGEYDRILCTATVREVPYSWVRAVRPGGLVVTNWGTPYHPDTLLRLFVREDGTADGYLVPHTHHEWLRGQRVEPTLTVAECEAALSRASTTVLGIDDIAGSDPNASIAIGLCVPNCASVFIPPGDQWFVDDLSGSWARLHPGAGGDRNIVNQYGPRDLWDEIEAAHHWWLTSGTPRARSWRVTVTPDGTHIEPALALR